MLNFYYIKFQLFFIITFQVLNFAHGFFGDLGNQVEGLAPEGLMSDMTHTLHVINNAEDLTKLTKNKYRIKTKWTKRTIITTTEIPIEEETIEVHEYGLRKSDIKFLYNVALGKYKKSHKEMSEKIYKTLLPKTKKIYASVRDNQLFRAYISAQHNLTEGVINAFNAMTEGDLGEFLHNWYKSDRNPHGKIKEVEHAIEHAEREATEIPTDKKLRESGLNEVTTEVTPEEVTTQECVTQKSEIDKHGEKIEHAANKVGLKAYSKEQLMKDLIEEQRRANNTANVE